jgi:hypothetical protein
MSNKQNTSGGIGIGMILFLIFMVLKLTGFINWSWWWVTAPLWIPVLAVIAIGGIALLIAYIGYKNKQ